MMRIQNLNILEYYKITNLKNSMDIHFCCMFHINIYLVINYVMINNLLSDNFHIQFIDQEL